MLHNGPVRRVLGRERPDHFHCASVDVGVDEPWVDERPREVPIVAALIGSTDLTVGPGGHDAALVNCDGPIDQNAPLGVHGDHVPMPQDQVDVLSVHVHTCLGEAPIDRSASASGCRWSWW